MLFRSSAVRLRVSLATPYSIMGYAKVNDEVTGACSITEVFDDLEVSSLRTGAWGNPSGLDLVARGLEEGPELLDHPIVRFGGTYIFVVYSQLDESEGDGQEMRVDRCDVN